MNEATREEALHAILADDLEFHTEVASATNPAFRAALDDAERLQEVLDKLVKLRKALGLTQSEVARRMGVRQPTVSGFETESSDPKLSSLQRYARAVEAEIQFVVSMPANCDWVADRGRAYRGVSASAPRAEVKQTALASRWLASAIENNYGLAA
ncbi:helix-turn-helix transcriptional regulator [Rhodococcus sp. MEB032]|uniref:helix-turn-helix domain-containing protein n=1 Tax=Rhodococcus sp. MEB032 TaxID=3040322 RepID=UPI003306E4C5